MELTEEMLARLTTAMPKLLRDYLADVLRKVTDEGIITRGQRDQIIARIWAADLADLDWNLWVAKRLVGMDSSSQVT
jgi:hypothetical protein